MIRFVLLATLACLAVADPSGFSYSHNGYESDVNRVQAQRQFHVNAVARHVGSGTGTARKDGVPGTPLGVTGHDRYSYGHGYGHGKYGHNYYGGHGYGHGVHGYGYGQRHGYGNSYGFTSDLNRGFHGYGGY